MTELFLTVVNMSISAGWIVLAVLLIRLLLKKAPKWINVLPWGIVAVRLICPFSIESALSLIPSPQTINPEAAINQPKIDSGISIIDQAVNPIISDTTIPLQPEKDINLFQLVMPYLAGIWILGMIAMTIYTVISYARISRRIKTAVLLRDNVYQSENVASPFVLGIIKPKIYLPFNMTEQDREYVIAHEAAHIRRKDHLWKPIGFLLLTLHWFNPLLWLGYVLLCRDIELACDEKVIRELDHDARADYSQALLTCSVKRRIISACPLAFGEVGVKNRIKSVLNYKKPAFWIIIAAIVACTVLAVCFLTNPLDPKESLDDKLKVYVDTQIAGHFQSDETEGRASCLDWEVLGKKQRGSTTTLYMWVLYEEYSYNGKELKVATGSHIPTVITVKKENGQYKLIEYWEAKDGSYHTPSIKEKFPWYLHGKALNSQRYIDKQKERCLQMALDYFGLSSVPESSGKDTANGLIYGFIPPAGDSDKLLCVYIENYGCDVKDVDIEFKGARFENGQMIFDIRWTNNGKEYVDIGPDFEVYKYDKNKPIKQKHNGVWLLYREILAGKGISVTDSDGTKIEYENLSSYNLSGHYDVFTAGKYRFVAHGAWVEFQIIDNCDLLSVVYDSATFDIDGDGKEEICSMRRGKTSGLFTFDFLVQNKDSGDMKYETTIYSQVYKLSFQKDADGVTKVRAVTMDETPRTHFFDISIKNGYVHLTENGVPIGEVK